MGRLRLQLVASHGCLGWRRRPDFGGSVPSSGSQAVPTLWKHAGGDRREENLSSLI